MGNLSQKATPQYIIKRQKEEGCCTYAARTVFFRRTLTLKEKTLKNISGSAYIDMQEVDKLLSPTEDGDTPDTGKKTCFITI